MNFEQRTNQIGTLLRETILPRYKRPDHLDDNTARAELRDMVDDLNAHWPQMPESRFEIVGAAMARALRASYQSRNWPSIAHMVKALKTALTEPAPSSTGNSVASKIDHAEARGKQLLGWVRGENACGEDLITRENLAVLVRAGHIQPNQVGAMLDFAAMNKGTDDEPKAAERSLGRFERIKV